MLLCGWINLTSCVSDLSSYFHRLDQWNYRTDRLTKAKIHDSWGLVTARYWFQAPNTHTHLQKNDEGIICSALTGVTKIMGERRKRCQSTVVCYAHIVLKPHQAKIIKITWAYWCGRLTLSHTVLHSLTSIFYISTSTDWTGLDVRG